MALAPVAVLVATVIWGVLLFLTRTVSIASIVSAAALPVAVYAFQGVTPVLWLSLALSSFVIYAHRSNIRRLLRGEEPSFRKAVH
jgi:glycerol-3-phosphate acyltransferase PlsY